VIAATGLEITTLVIAVVGAAVAVFSLAWNIVSYVSSGVRVRATMTCGLLTPSGYAQWEPAKHDRPYVGGVSGEPVFGVVVQNTGRLPAVVTKVAFGTELVVIPHVADGPSPAVPHTINVSAQALWFVRAADVANLVRTSKMAKDKHGSDKVSFSIGLGSGKTVRTATASGSKALKQLLSLPAA
jgi:hypothetical protein